MTKLTNILKEKKVTSFSNTDELPVNTIYRAIFLD